MQSKLHEAKLNQDLVATLADAGERLPDSVCTSIIDRGSEVIPDLIAILEDDKLASTDAPGDGCVPIHAATILQKLKAFEAIEPMLEVLSRCECMDILYSQLIDALQSFGHATLEPALQAYAVAKLQDQRDAISSVLSGIGVHDPRIFSILLKQLEENVVLGAGDLAEYDDPAAVPYLSAALDACELDTNGGMFANQEIIELAEAIKELGGTLTESQANLRQAVIGRRPKIEPKIERRAALPLRSLSLPLCGRFMN